MDTLIEERAPKLSNGPLWPYVRPVLYAMLNYAKARSMADRIGPMSGADALDYVLKAAEREARHDGP
ncbi:MAG: hypothetical protein WDM79_06615 [Terricaulis sp.]